MFDSPMLSHSESFLRRIDLEEIMNVLSEKGHELFLTFSEF
jgi:hypothetical protein